MSNKKLYTEEDLKNAFTAGEALVNADWHIQEFCSIDCNCFKNKIDYNSVEDWLQTYKDSK